MDFVPNTFDMALHRQQFLHNTIEINVNIDKSKRGFVALGSTFSVGRY